MRGIVHSLWRSPISNPRTNRVHGSISFDAYALKPQSEYCSAGRVRSDLEWHSFGSNGITGPLETARQTAAVEFSIAIRSFEK